MALVIENGSLVANANSYVSVEEARAFAAARASALVDDMGDEEIEAALIRGCDYLETFRNKYQGSKVASTQELCWPRECVTVEGFPVAINEIPVLLKKAQMQLVIEDANGTVDLMPTGDGRDLIREKTDVLESEWAPGSGGSAQPTFAKVMAYLGPLFSNLPGTIRVYRA